MSYIIFRILGFSFWGLGAVLLVITTVIFYRWDIKTKAKILSRKSIYSAERKETQIRATRMSMGYNEEDTEILSKQDNNKTELIEDRAGDSTILLVDDKEETRVLAESEDLYGLIQNDNQKRIVAGSFEVTSRVVVTSGSENGG
ncbi:MAG: hypothetical protein IJZ00_02890 [Lachnospiraceae bacterium]|nr:hypothetical protein [Lachnospiraceae bacterium]